MSHSASNLRDLLLRLSNQIAECLAGTPYNPPESSAVSVKEFLQSLLPPPPSDCAAIYASIRDFSLACALLSFPSTFEPFTPDHFALLSWIPTRLSSLAATSFLDLSEAYAAATSEDGSSDKVSELGLSRDSVPRDKW